MRIDYNKHKLEDQDVNPNPIFQFEKWFQEAKDAHVHEPYAMTLATANAEGHPSARVVLMRRFDETGFVFFTNYLSRKGVDILENPNAALLFFWQDLERQVRIEGTLEKVTREESEMYFQSRPHESKIGAWTSEQGRVIANRKVLDERFKEFSLKYPEEHVPCPPHWGGYILKPTCIEFWQGRPSRLHDRILFTLVNGAWNKERLAP